MEFAELYKKNREAVANTLTSMWCGEAANDSQRAYAEQLKEIIKGIFAPEDAVPVVQCMNSYKSVFSATDEEARDVVGGLWKAPYSPYEHQYQSWKVLLDKEKARSIVVTTGTGSGKTECFMMPLVHDLKQHPASKQIQALFLYPLNALMEDQKDRLEQLLDGTNIRYTVYNGDLPEKEPSPTASWEDNKEDRERIEMITGGKYKQVVIDEETGRKGWKLFDLKYSHMVYTREMVRKNPPNIVLTNPTMLEYILLRGSDAKLISPELKSLRWVVIDEPHTYTGAGAAEMAMLLRRVLIAFNVKADDVRFATSSATFSNADTEDMTEEEREKAKEKEIADLKAFISGITGVSKELVEVIGGERVGEDCIPDNEDGKLWRKIFDDEFVELNKLFPQGKDINDRLEQFDALCQREDERNKANGLFPVLKAKVHYFYRVPNNGLYVCLNEHKDGAFKIYTEKVSKDEEHSTPMLELSRCKRCGEYVALAIVNTKEWTYNAPISDDSDMYDIVEDADNDDSEIKYTIFGLSNSTNTRGDNNAKFTISPDGKLRPLRPGEGGGADWALVGNTQCCCPYCTTKQSRSRSTEKDVDHDSIGDMDSIRLQKFRVSPDFISRVLAPSILDQLDKNESEDEGLVLHDGQQYISFVDSRQAAARATLKQNLEEERLWFYTTIYHELCRRRAETDIIEKQIKELTKKMHNYDEDSDEYEDLFMERKKLRRSLTKYVTWMEVADMVKNSKYFDLFFKIFLDNGKEKRDYSKTDDIDLLKERYCQSIMVMYLANKLNSAASNETMGLFHVCYPQLEKIKELPVEVEEFNKLFDNPVNRITIGDWRNLIQIFMDHSVRSNQSFFLKDKDIEYIDIFSTTRFATEKQRRRPVNKPTFEDDNRVSKSRVIQFLSGLLVRDDQAANTKEAQRVFHGNISNVIDALWDTINNPDYNLLEIGWRCDPDSKLSRSRRQHEETDNAPRLNLVNLSFKLYDDVYLCDTNTDGSERHSVCLRPVPNNFKLFSPYLEGGHPIDLKESLHETWEPYPYYVGSDKEVTPEIIKRWAKDKRTILWNNHLWGEDGVFAARLEEIHLTPNLFIQAEHTAQVDKDVARGLQTAFKEHKINIMACSTTMEMGVDLGNLEVVLLSSVPPMPANYKQRAGRSGRNNKIKSVCITLCGSDSIGLRTLYNPIEKIINRKVMVPTVDLMSPQVIQRHVNSFLIRSFGVFRDGQNGGSLRQRVLDYYTTYRLTNDGTHLTIVNEANQTMDASAGLGFQDGTMFDVFRNKCAEPLTKELKHELGSLLRETIFDGKQEFVVKKASDMNTRCYTELSEKLEDIKIAIGQPGISNGFRVKLNLQFMEILTQQLLNYWATSRFTPNANMPVNVLSLDLNSAEDKAFFTKNTSSNPSYSLREAISQYAPGSCIVVDGVVHIVRGIQFRDIYKGVNTFKQIFHNSEKTIVNDGDALSNKIPWRVNENVGLDLIQPTGFLPDINEDKTRIIDNPPYTRVSAQLIDVDDWATNITEPHLFSMRSNKESGDAKILYYNEGRGFGYCFCTQCGRMVLEDDVADEEDKMNTPFEFNPVGKKGKPKFHYAINGKDYKQYCHASRNEANIKRNVIIGDLIQTDFTEVRIRHKGKRKWISNRLEEECLLTTLGITFSQCLVDILGKERGAVDFAVMPNGHFCIFDTNPGGAGYSNQLANIQVMKDVISAAKEVLSNAKNRNNKDLLLDKFTLRYLPYIDIDAALDWIKEEEEASKNIPEEIKGFFNNASETTLAKLEEAFKASYQDSVLFVDNEYKDWDYNGDENGWRGHLLPQFIQRGQQTKFCVANSRGRNASEPILSMLREIKAWTNGVQTIDNEWASKGVYPLAYIDNCLYLTNEKRYAALNDTWGSGALFCVRTKNPIANAVDVDLSYKPSTKVLKLSDSDVTEIKTSELAALIQGKSNGLIEQFIDYARQNGSDIRIIYQDEHLKSIMGMILTIQTVEHFVKQIGSNFELEYLVETYDDLNGKSTSITANLPDARERNNWLNNLTESWLDDLESECGITGELVPVVSMPKKSLTHWRELRIECGNKCLCIYPDGGFINGWNISRDNEHYDISEITYDANIKLFRNHEIKYDVTIEDC